MGSPEQQSRQQFNQMLAAETRVQFDDGRSAIVRRPHMSDFAAIADFYGNLSHQDIVKRFFATVTRERAVQYGIESTSLVSPETCRDFIASLGRHGSALAGIAGYEIKPGAKALVHMLVGPEFRHQGTPRVSRALLESTLNAAAFDSNVDSIHLETLATNIPAMRLTKQVVDGNPRLSIMSRNFDSGVYTFFIAKKTDT